MSRLEYNDPDLDRLRRWVHNTLGIEFPDDKLDSLKRRLDDVIRTTNLPDYASLYKGLTDPTQSALQVKVSQSMTTNHTAFFRENDALECLFQKLPPRNPGEPLRVWSAACSTGEEPYSLAMRSREHFGPRADATIAFLATDISHRAIETTTAGRYPRRAMGGVSEERRGQFFTSTDDDHFVVRPGVKQLCTFRRLNLAVATWPFRKQFHAIYCRNVLYYFDKGLRARVARRLYDHIVPGGYLYTSVTEALRALDTPWVYIKPGVYLKDAS